jgi:hypothetical protein
MDPGLRQDDIVDGDGSGSHFIRLLSFAALQGGEVKLDPGSEAGEDSLMD